MKYRSFAVVTFVVLIACDEKLPQPPAARVDTARVAVPDTIAVSGLEITGAAAFVFAPPPPSDSYGDAAMREFRDNFAEVSDSLRALGYQVVASNDSIVIGKGYEMQVLRPCERWQGCVVVYLTIPGRCCVEVYSGPFLADEVMKVARKQFMEETDRGPWDYGAWSSNHPARFMPPILGDVSKDDVRDDDAGQWLALQRADTVAELTSVNVTFDAVPLDCSVEPEEREAYKEMWKTHGRVFRLTPAIGFDALIRNAPAVVPGRIPAAKLVSVDSGEARVGPTEYLPRRASYMYRGEPLELVRMPADYIEMRFRGRRYQLIRWGYFDEGRWNTRIDWIGDLNRDGMPDAILDISPKYTSEHWFWFFLSDPANPELGPQLVDRTSQFGCGHI